MPKFLTCDICGREFGSASLAIHRPQCYDKAAARNDLLAPEQRQRLPSRDMPVATGTKTGGKDSTWDNEAAQKAYESNMSECDYCGRTFTGPDRLAIHHRSCTPDNPAKSVAGKGPKSPRDDRPKTLAGKSVSSPLSATSPGKFSSPAKPAPTGPKFLTCDICGREFGSSSLGIHRPQCYDKFMARNEALAPEQRARLPPKDMPIRSSGSGTGGTQEWDNQAAQKAYEANMPECPNCGRTFSGQDRLDVHLRSCKVVSDSHSTPARSSGLSATAGASPSKPSPLSSTTPKATPTGPRFMTCDICGREFGSSSLGIHRPQCYEKFVARNEQVEPEKRSKLPPKDMPVASPKARGSAGEWDNEAAAKAYEARMAGCPHCGRTFSGQDRLDIHLRSCSAEKPARASVKLRQAQEDDDSSEDEPVVSSHQVVTPTARVQTAARTTRPKVDEMRSAPSPVKSTPTPASPQATLPKFCTMCGTAFLADEQRFCGSCGSKRGS